MYTYIFKQKEIHRYTQQMIYTERNKIAESNVQNKGYIQIYTSKVIHKKDKHSFTKNSRYKSTQ